MIPHIQILIIFVKAWSTRASALDPLFPRIEGEFESFPGGENAVGIRGICRVEGGAKKLRRSGEKLNGVMAILCNYMVCKNTPCGGRRLFGDRDESQEENCRVLHGLRLKEGVDCKVEHIAVRSRAHVRCAWKKHTLKLDHLLIEMLHKHLRPVLRIDRSSQLSEWIQNEWTKRLGCRVTCRLGKINGLAEILVHYGQVRIFLRDCMKISRTCTLWSPHITIEKAQLEEVEAKLKPSKNLNSMVHGISGVEMVSTHQGGAKDMVSCWLNLRLPNAGFDGMSIPNHQSVEQLPHLEYTPAVERYVMHQKRQYRGGKTLLSAMLVQISAGITLCRQQFSGYWLAMSAVDQTQNYWDEFKEEYPEILHQMQMNMDRCYSVATLVFASVRTITVRQFVGTLHKIYTFIEAQGNKIKQFFRNTEMQNLLKDCYEGLDQAKEVFGVRLPL
ncbi:hypothetical protein B0H14DRAFT_2563821 [Mycena olivaceomarginata]|nr:hypothetical protein B0H14DRAFT_2563821 [Mycena olivaceomarginata]